MIRLKRKPKGDDFPEDVCAAYKCEAPTEITLGAGVLRPFAVPLCDKHNAKRCEEEEAADAAAEPESEDAKLAREAAWRAKVKAENSGKTSESDPVTEPIEDGPPDLEAFINAPLNEKPKPKRKRKRKPKAKTKAKCGECGKEIDRGEGSTDTGLCDVCKAELKLRPKPSGNGKGTIPVGVIKRALIGSGVSAAALSNLGQQQTERWMTEHLSEEDRQRVLDNARKMSRTPRVRPRQS